MHFWNEKHREFLLTSMLLEITLLDNIILENMLRVLRMCSEFALSVPRVCTHVLWVCSECALSVLRVSYMIHVHYLSCPGLPWAALSCINHVEWEFKEWVCISGGTASLWELLAELINLQWERDWKDKIRKSIWQITNAKTTNRASLSCRGRVHCGIGGTNKFASPNKWSGGGHYGHNLWKSFRNSKSSLENCPG